MLRKKKNQLKKLVCPFCQNDSIVIYLDFAKKDKNSVRNMGICTKNDYVSRIFKRSFTKGCGRRFKINFK